MKPRNRTTQFRASQARVVLEGTLRAIAPHMMGEATLRAELIDIISDGRLWAELELLRRPIEVEGTAVADDAPVLSIPIREPAR